MKNSSCPPYRTRECQLHSQVQKGSWHKAWYTAGPRPASPPSLPHTHPSERALAQNRKRYLPNTSLSLSTGNTVGSANRFPRERCETGEAAKRPTQQGACRVREAEKSLCLQLRRVRWVGTAILKFSQPGKWHG